MSEGLTRRDALRGAATVGAGVLLAPGAARAAGGATVFRQAVGTLAAGGVTTVRLTRPACLAAVGWSAPDDAHVWLRARRADGRWSPWATASTAGHDGDGVRARTPVGEGIWFGSARELQVRSGGALDGVTVTLVAATTGSEADDVAGPRSLPLAGPALAAGPGQPPIIARRAWAGGDHPPVAGPFYGTIEMGIVHHTENPNGYAPGDVPAMLQAIYEFHVHGRGWYDIGYNFVIDRFGRIWEARQGGVDLPVIGAQAGDWNQISFGVSMLGTYDAVSPSPAAMAALERLLAWKLALSGLPATGEVTAVASADGISYTPFRVGERLRFPRIAGHRDVDSTDCPGDALYARLPGVRPAVARLIGAPVTLTVGGELSTGATGPATLALSGRLRRGGAPVAGAPIALQAIVGRAGDSRPLAAATTDATGAWSAAIPAHAGMLVRALHGARPAAVSDLVAVGALGAEGAGDALS